MPYLPENPRMPESCPAYHYPVHPIAVKSVGCIFRSPDVPVTYYGYMHTRVLLHLANQRPICLSLIHLAAGASVNGQGLNPRILQTFSKFHYYFRVFVPAQARLDRHRFPHSLHHHPCYFHHLVRLLHHPAPCSPACNFAHRTSEIDVNQVSTVSLNQFRSPVRHSRRIHHSLRNAPVNLNPHRPFIIVSLELFQRFARVPYKPVRRNELGIDHIRPVFLAGPAERRIGHVLHRSQKQGLVPEHYVFAYFH